MLIFERGRWLHRVQIPSGKVLTLGTDSLTPQPSTGTRSAGHNAKLGRRHCFAGQQGCWEEYCQKAGQLSVARQ